MVGGGPAGLMAAERLAVRGIGVDLYDAMPSLGRKFLMAGKSGLNITHTEDEARFLSRYRCEDSRLQEMVKAFGPPQILDWMAGLGIERHVGSTGRVFPVQMKSSVLLRAWLRRLDEAGVRFVPRHRWTGWNADGALLFLTPDGDVSGTPAATIFALGGGSWRRLGSDGTWMKLFKQAGVPCTPFRASNAGFVVPWSDLMKTKHAGAPVKAVALSVDTPEGIQRTRSEFVITKRGLESGGIYALSAPLMDQIEKTGRGELHLDLFPDLTMEMLRDRLLKPRGKQSASNWLRKSVRLTGARLALLYEFTDKSVMDDPARLTNAMKNLTIPITGPVPIDEAISTAGGVSWSSLDDQLMLKDRPGIFCAGEMLDWDAPTGGYLLTACLATGLHAGGGAAAFLQSQYPSV